MRELCVGKLACTVLRGEGRGDAPDLPGMKTMELLKKFKDLALYAALEMLLWSLPAGSRRSQVRN